jgi:hypothetical protein
MKPAQTLIDSLGTLAAVTTTGDLRRIVSNAMLALVRKEVSNTDLVSLSKGLDSITSSLQVEVNIEKVKTEMRRQAGRTIVADPESAIGSLAIGHAVSGTERSVSE